MKTPAIDYAPLKIPRIKLQYRNNFFYLKTDNTVYWCGAWNSIISIILPA